MKEFYDLINDKKEQIRKIRNEISLKFLINILKELEKNRNRINNIIENQNIEYINVITESHVLKYKEIILNLIIDVYINKWPIICNNLVIQKNNEELWKIQWIKTELENIWWHNLYPWIKHKPIEIYDNYKWKGIWLLLYIIHDFLFWWINQELTDTSNWNKHLKMLLWFWYYPVKIALNKHYNLPLSDRLFQEYIYNILWIKNNIELDENWYIIILQK